MKNLILLIAIVFAVSFKPGDPPVKKKAPHKPHIRAIVLPPDYYLKRSDTLDIVWGNDTMVLRPYEKAITGEVDHDRLWIIVVKGK